VEPVVENARLRKVITSSPEFNAAATGRRGVRAVRFTKWWERRLRSGVVLA